MKWRNREGQVEMKDRKLRNSAKEKQEDDHSGQGEQLQIWPQCGNYSKHNQEASVAREE